MTEARIFVTHTSGLQKVGKNKLLIDNTNGDITLSTIQTNWNIKAVKNEKMTKLMKRTTDVVVAAAATV
jgi:hypothetical protein